MHPLHATVYRNRSGCLDSCAYVPAVITVPPRDVAVLREQERGTERHYRGTNCQWSGYAFAALHNSHPACPKSCKLGQQELQRPRQAAVGAGRVTAGLLALRGRDRGMLSERIETPSNSD
jgi:hypothetical protein